LSDFNHHRFVGLIKHQQGERAGKPKQTILGDLLIASSSLFDSLNNPIIHLVKSSWKVIEGCLNINVPFASYDFV
jgi:hypothetical protein